MGHCEAWSLAIPRAAAFASVRRRTDKAVSGIKHHTAPNTMHGEAFCGVLKVGRSHMQDAAPVTFGQEFGGYDAQLALAETGIR